MLATNNPWTKKVQRFVSLRAARYGNTYGIRFPFRRVLGNVEDKQSGMRVMSRVTKDTAQKLLGDYENNIKKLRNSKGSQQAHRERRYKMKYSL